MTQTLIDSEKIHAYLATEYRLEQPLGELILSIGIPCQPLATLFAAHTVNSGALITAYNPQGTQQQLELNERAQRALIQTIETLKLPYLHGNSGESTGTWPTEPNLFILGIPLETAKHIGTVFAQDALLWVTKDCIPQLILLR